MISLLVKSFNHPGERLEKASDLQGATAHGANMIHRLAKLLLAPVLLTQGIYVKRVTPRLPEPEGVRSGVFGAGPALKLLIVGDSAAAGVGVATQQKALSGRLVEALGTSHEVSWKLVAKTGDASGQILDKLKSVSSENFDIIVVSVGVNDVTSQTGNREWLDNLNCILELLKSRFKAGYIILSAVPPMHLFPALPQPLRWWLGLRAKQLNGFMETVARINNNCTFLSITFPLDQEFMAEDGFHPGDAAYKHWGIKLARVMRTELSPIKGP